MSDLSQSPKTSLGYKFLLGFLSLAVIISAVFAALNAAALGWPAFALLAGIAGVAAICLMSFLAKGKAKSQSNDRRFADRDTPYSEAFFKSPTASLITREGKAIHANKAYLEFIKPFGTLGASEAPPTIDHLFVNVGNETASAIFRLNHIGQNTPMAEEFIDVIDSDSVLRRYHIHVSNLGDEHLWQIRDVTQESHGEESLLVGAPVGLFSVTAKGDIIATNAVLDRWLGGEALLRPDHMREFIEDIDSLLGSPATPGRVVRADTRLITRKGIVTPTIMVGTWHELDSGDIVASVALYGHSSLGVQNSALAVPKGAVPIAANDKATGFATAPVAILHLDGQILGGAVVKSANHAFERMSNGLSWEGLSFSNVFAPQDELERFLACLLYTSPSPRD